MDTERKSCYQVVVPGGNLTFTTEVTVCLPPLSCTPLPALKSKDGLESKSETSILDPGVLLASSGEFVRACASDKPAIPDPMMATRSTGGERDLACCDNSDHSSSAPNTFV